MKTKILFIVIAIVCSSLSSTRVQGGRKVSPIKAPKVYYITKMGMYYFIPEYQYESLKYAQLGSNESDRDSTDLISLSIKEGNSTIKFSKGKDVNSKTFTPEVDNYVTLKVSSEIGDSVVITSDFVNLHLENQSKYISLLGVKPDSILTDRNENNMSIIEDSLHNLIDRDSTLIAELKTYISYISKVQPNKKQWLYDILFIKTNICIAYAIKDFSLDSLEAKTKSKIITQLLKAILSYNAPLYVSTLPKQIENKDVLSFNVKVFDKNKEIQAATYNYYIKGGFKIDFSTGLDFHTLSDISLSIRYITDKDGTKYKIIVSEPANFLTPGACVLAHFYSRKPSIFNWGFTTGFDVATDSKLKYLAGVSFIWGREQRFISSVGFILGQTKTISSKYRLYKPYLATDFGDPTVNQLTIEKYNLGFFLSLSYNLGK